MRISDWSSDVCSSDLLFMQQRRQYFRVPAAAGCIFDDGLVRLHPEEGERFGRMAIGVAGDIGGGAAGRGDGGGDRIGRLVLVRMLGGEGKQRAGKLGRASGRERVCPSVLISVVHGSLKKKKKKRRSLK